MPSEGVPAISTTAYILGALLFLPTLYVLATTGYLVLLTLGSLLYRTPRENASQKLRVAVLIPAHNEAGQIDAILEDFQRQDYPPEARSVFVIADNCTDATAERARAAGANALERHDPERSGKGQALDWCLKTHAALLAEFDVIALIDADMHIDPGFTKAVADALSKEDVQVVQGLNIVARPEKTWRSALGFASFAVINHLRPAGRCFLGGTADLKGSGMAFRASVLLSRGWPAHSLAEDAEFAKQLLLDGIRVRYVPTAKVTSEMPATEGQSRVQQQRWEGGKLALLRRFFPMLFRATLRSPSIALVDALIDLMVPPISILALLLLACLAASLAVHALWTALLLVCAAGIALVVAVALLQAGAPPSVWLALAMAPLFVLWKIPIYARLLLRPKGGRWERTPRDSELEP